MQFRPLSVTVLRMISLFKHVVQCVPHVKPAAQTHVIASFIGLECNAQRSQDNSYQILGTTTY